MNGDATCRMRFLSTLTLAILAISIGGCGHDAAEREAQLQRVKLMRQDWAQEEARKARTIARVDSRAEHPPLVRPEEWGHLVARFVYEDEPPAQKPAKITSDHQFCGKQKVLLENLVVNPENGGVANIIVWLHRPRGESPPPVHDSYLKTLNMDVTLDADRCRFAPHICLLRTTQTLVIRNRNPIGDSAKIDAFDNSAISVMLSSGDQHRCRLPQPERMPVHVSCSVHPWESAWLLVKNHPYMAASSENGQIEIKHLPVGKWSFQFWQEKAGYVSEVERDGQRTTWPRGRTELSIEPGENDLGKIVLQPSLFDE